MKTKESVKISSDTVATYRGGGSTESRGAPDPKKKHEAPLHFLEENVRKKSRKKKEKKKSTPP